MIPSMGKKNEFIRITEDASLVSSCGVLDLEQDGQFCSDKLAAFRNLEQSLCPSLVYGGLMRMTVLTALNYSACFFSVSGQTNSTV